MGLIGPPGTEATTDAVGDELTLWLSRAGVGVCLGFRHPDAHARRDQFIGNPARAVETLLPGARRLLANLFTFMRGLSPVPYHMRRTSSALHRDLITVADLLQRNMGRDYYRFDEFRRMPAVYVDALKSPRYEGGCYFSRSGHYRY
eukprot:744591-Pleurochrysis_carterae.AAC.1